MDVSVIIPTLNAEHEIEDLLAALERQSLRPMEILVVDSASDDDTVPLVKMHEGIRLLQIERCDFNHGATRDMALRATTGDFVCFLTQDALPASDAYLERLVTPMVGDPSIALVSGRQLPKADARRFEQLVRSFNYPDSPSVRSKSDLNKCGIKTFFASDSCSAYRRTAYLDCSGFEYVNTNEDMLMAARFVASGLKVAYEPGAEVYHSHNLTPSQQFARNRAVGMFLESHSDDLMHASEIGEGGRLVKAVSSQLLREGNLTEFIAFGVDCCARLLGNRAGRRAARKERL
ncbi:glycosyltransferase family 2 protein [Collinsella aerofaciens]|uniref:glycosyltransferase family 2 protein n=1 Tax=Collinsella aerofaciens TaxID=74426 RepID=UPI001897259F|nr:glycosyltransferase family 2 protein [Collinsella aerofaciens]MDB1866758.1 glycosyltransferase family 2 protein [Collinsella aerofaciens]MDB1870617.1 glycosyltransferase family 2 protein [Collinsella aerofaciens]MDB1874253.1 glycosyltransferase family 2 protein [Collinsella aerofaciens]